LVNQNIQKTWTDNILFFKIKGMPTIDANKLWWTK